MNLKKFDEFLSKELRRLQTVIASEVSNEVMNREPYNKILNERVKMFEWHQHLRLWVIASIVRRASNAVYSHYDNEDYEKAKAIAKSVDRLLEDYNEVAATLWGTQVPLASLTHESWVKKQNRMTMEDIFGE